VRRENSFSVEFHPCLQFFFFLTADTTTPSLVSGKECLKWVKNPNQSPFRSMQTLEWKKRKIAHIERRESYFLAIN
jgi:hypothetical protein